MPQVLPAGPLQTHLTASMRKGSPAHGDVDGVTEVGQVVHSSLAVSQMAKHSISHNRQKMEMTQVPIDR